MNRAPAISTALRTNGFHDHARELDKAPDASAEILALRLALAAVDGAQQVLRCYARSLRTTQAAGHRASLRMLEDQIVAHMGGLLRRASAAQNLRAVRS